LLWNPDGFQVGSHDINGSIGVQTALLSTHFETFVARTSLTGPSIAIEAHLALRFEVQFADG